MLDSLFQPIYQGTISIQIYLICILVSLATGAFIAFAASRRSRLSKSFLLAIFLLPPVVQTVIMMVNGSIGTGIAVMGAFSLIRFRSAPGTAREIVAIFTAMAAGLASAAGYITLAILFTLIIGFIIIVTSYINLKERDDLERELRITIPESLNFEHEFDDIFKQYTSSYRLLTVKTTNMGSLYKLKYLVQLKSTEGTKSFIDELRCRNGNLEISVTLPVTERNEL